MNKNILMCLNRLDIGGVETVVVNQTIELIEKGYNIVILSEKGIYTEVLQKKGATCITFPFELTDGYDLEKAKKIEDIINKYDIGQVHIHQLDCITSAFPACLVTNTPYVAYVHTGVRGIYDWFERTFSGYRGMFDMYFNTAQKIVAITEEAKKENKEKYNVPEEKYIIINNSIRFDEKLLNNKKIPTKIEKFLIVSRLSEEKLKSIKNAIKIFENYYKENKNATLTIVGDGPYSKQIENEVQDIKEATKFLGARNDVIDILLDYDVVMALDRCILEAVATKRIAIISGYENSAGIVTNENIKKAAESNFSGRNIKEEKIEKIVKELKSLNKEKIEKLVNENYKYAYEKLNIKNNIYIIDANKKEEMLINKNIYLKDEKNLTDRIKKEIERTDKVYKDCKEAQKYFETQIDNLEKDNKNLRELLKKYEKAEIELEKIQNSRSWIYSRKIVNFIKRNKSQKD